MDRNQTSLLFDFEQDEVNRFMNTIDEALLVSDSPQSLQIEVTSRCNLKCKMCPLTTGDTLSSAHPGHMTHRIDSLEMLRKEPVKPTRFSGGI